ncbi:type II secretion system (T2SS) protein F [Stenotrophomonas sp. AG209]|nr:type II secretion system (T2SS) protein F [Stenotrophomonas sp. AG209]
MDRATSVICGASTQGVDLLTSGFRHTILYAFEIERRAMALTALLEPTMILVMGGVVLTIVLAVLMPIMEMNQLVQ